MEVEKAAGHSRGEFIRRTAGVTGLVVGAGLWTREAHAAPSDDPDADAAAAAAAAGRSFAAGHFVLELDGSTVGVPSSVDGGNTFSDVVVEKVGASYYPRKHLGGVKYEDISFKIDFAVDQDAYDWISAMWLGQAPRKDGAVITVDVQQNVKSRREFRDALLTETTIPALDAASKDAAFLTLVVTPEQALTRPGSGKATVPPVKKKQWLTSNFRLEIDGLDATKVNKIEAFTVKQGVTTNPIGESRDFALEPTSLEFPNLTITLAQTSAQTWYDWFDDFVVQGNNGQDKERNGTLTFLGPNLKDELGEVRFFNLGIFKLSLDTSGGGNQVARVKAELYCERMEFGPPAAPG